MTLDFLLRRRSVVAAQLSEPGPDAEQLDAILRAAIRVPDHKALAPWRFIVFSGDARKAVSEATSRIFATKQTEDVRDIRMEAERVRFMRAPVVIAVISSPKESEKVPQFEQLLSAGAACMNLLHAAAALGFAGQWVTEWLAYDQDVYRLLGLGEKEAIAGFIYIGSAAETPMERPRVEPKDVVSYWKD